MTLEELNGQAMEMIVHSGNGRNMLNQALDALYDGDEETYEAKMTEAKKEMQTAHAAQTKVLQETITDPKADTYSMLFAHAQDTLMTVMSEINTARHLAKIMKKLKEIANGK